jgi:cell division protein FtsB
VGAIYFVLQAGEYSTRDILRQRDHRRQLSAQVGSLQHEVDSLQRVERMIRADPVTQERIAREEFGLVRGDNEIIYKFVTPSSPDGVSR